MLDDAVDRLRSLGREIIAPRTLSDGPRQPARAARGHHQGQALDPLRVARRDALRDHAAHRRAADMRLGDAERVEHADASAAMSAERVRALDAQAERVAQRVEREVRHAGCVEALAQADVAVVEADDAKAARRRARATKSSCQPSSCMPRPMISSSGSPCGEPWSSTSRRDAVGRDLHRGGGGAVSPPSPSASGRAVRKNQRRAPDTSNGCHWPIGCARRSATAYSASGFSAHADVAGGHLDVLDQRAGLVQAAAPRDDAVAARVDRGRRHRRRLPASRAISSASPTLLGGSAARRRARRWSPCGWPVNGVPSVMTQRVALGWLLGHLARVEAAEAPADQADRLAVLRRRARGCRRRSARARRGAGRS